MHLVLTHPPYTCSAELAELKLAIAAVETKLAARRDNLSVAQQELDGVLALAKVRARVCVCV